MSCRGTIKYCSSYRVHVFISIVCILLCVTATWLGNVAINTTMKIVLQLKSISHRSNFSVYRYMFRSS
jgi:hypothetical protein